MPKELKEEYNLKTAIEAYKEEIGTEQYQPLETLLNKLKNLCQSSISQEFGLA